MSIDPDARLRGNERHRQPNLDEELDCLPIPEMCVSGKDNVHKADAVRPGVPRVLEYIANVELYDTNNQRETRYV